MRHRGFEPRTTWLKVKCSANWANTPFPEKSGNAWFRNRTRDTRIFCPLLYQLSYLGIWHVYITLQRVSCGSRIWTCDLRVMSPTSFQTAPPRDIKLLLCLSEAKPMIGLEPITCWLQISCSANWATSAHWMKRIRTVLVLANRLLCWITQHQWMEKDSNLRRRCQQIYSLPPLATRESIHVMGPIGLEPMTLCL